MGWLQTQFGKVTRGMPPAHARLLQFYLLLWAGPWVVFGYQVWLSTGAHVVRVLVPVGAFLAFDLFFLFGVLLVKESGGIPRMMFFGLFALTFVSFVGAFAAADLSASRSYVGCFHEAGSAAALTPVNAAYYALSTLSTTGFGDIAAHSRDCRWLSIAQLSIGFPTLALAIAGTSARVFRDLTK
jgi:hypothetical protein